MAREKIVDKQPGFCYISGIYFSRIQIKGTFGKKLNGTITLSGDN